MEVRVLGAHNTETTTTRHVTLLIDGALALDAGGLNGGLSLAEQDALQAILLTHQHFDHIKDVPTFGLNTLEASTTEVYGLSTVLQALQTHLLNGVLWGHLTEQPTSERPSLRLRPIVTGHGFRVADYQVVALPVNHSVPSVGYLVARDGRSLFYTGDTGPGLSPTWQMAQPDVLFIETTVPNRLTAFAREKRHLSPELLQAELEAFRADRGYLPRVFVVHHNPRFSAEIGAEISQIAQAVQADVSLAWEGMCIQI